MMDCEEDEGHFHGEQCITFDVVEEDGEQTDLPVLSESRTEILLQPYIIFHFV